MCWLPCAHFWATLASGTGYRVWRLWHGVATVFLGVLKYVGNALAARVKLHLQINIIL